MVNRVCHLISEDSCLTFQMLASKYDVGKDTRQFCYKKNVCSFCAIIIDGNWKKTENGCVLNSSGND